MAVPDFQSLMRPVLEMLVEQGAMQVGQIAKVVSARLMLSDDDLA